MPKFGQIWFSGGIFGDKHICPANFKTTIHRVPLGFAIRKKFRVGNYRRIHGPDLETSRAIIFRVRPGNGYFGAQWGERYQDKYKYFIPSSINNIQGAASRTALANAVSNWKNVLDEATKQEYHKKAVKRGKMSGYNLYVGEYIKAHT